MTPRRIIIDCDPGHDDAIAIMLAHGNPEVELLAITTVGGNQTLDKVTHNARVVATICGMTGVPIAAGSAVPLVRPIRHAGTIHGDTGLDGPVADTDSAAGRSACRRPDHRHRDVGRAGHHHPGTDGPAD